MGNKNKMFYGWWVVIGSVLVTATMVPSAMSMANKFLLQITEDMGISRSAFSLSNAILHAIGIFLSPFVTKKLAKGNLKKIQTISIIVYSLGYATYGLAQSPIHLYITSFLLGIAYLSATIIPVSIMITNWFDKKRGLAMSIALAGIGAGGFIFSPLITSGLGAFGWRRTYIIYAIIMLVVSLPASLFLLKKHPSDMGLKPLGADENDKEAKDTTSFDLSVSTIESLKNPFFIMLTLGMIFNGIINTGALGQFPPALEELHGSTMAAAIISLYSLMGILGKIALGWVNDKFGIIKGILFGTLSFALCFIMMLYGSNQVALYLMTIFFGFGNAIGPVLPPLLTAAIYGSSKYGEIYGYVNSANQLGLTFGSLLVASIFDISGSYRLAWIVMILFSLGVMISCIASYKSSIKYRKPVTNI